MDNKLVSIGDFEKLFPFCFVTDRKGSILHIGPTLQKLLPLRNLGSAFDNHFQVTRPQNSNFESIITAKQSEMINLKIQNQEVELMGQIILIDQENLFLFVTNLVVHDAQVLARLGLTFNDFAIQDPIFDFLMLLQTQRRAIKQAEIMNAKLEEAHKVAVRASEAKSQFLANMSHELRTPMNGLLGMASILLETELSEEQKDYVQTLVKSGETMLSLVNDILDLSKIEAGYIALESQSINIKEHIDEVFRAMAPLASKKNIHLSFAISSGVPKFFLSDPGRLRQVLTNLIGNAIKFTNNHGSVTLSVKCLSIDEKRTVIEFVVKDNGIGMSKETLQRIFSPFVQGDSSMTKKFEGTGLGLTICKKLVESMGGKISVESSLGAGSEFRFYGSYELDSPEEVLLHNFETSN